MTTIESVISETEDAITYLFCDVKQKNYESTKKELAARLRQVATEVEKRQWNEEPGNI